MNATTTQNLSNTVATALAPIIWGSTYIATTQWLPEGRPITAAVVRTLPAGILLLLSVKTSVKPKQIPTLWFLALLNISAFQALLFTAAYLLPGGIAAVIGAIQPLLMMFLIWGVDRRSPDVSKFISAIFAIAGMMLLFAAPGPRDAHWNGMGILAALGGTFSMCLGVFLSGKLKHHLSVFEFTGWQLTLGGITLLPFALLFEMPVAQPTSLNLFGYFYICIFGALLGYTLWFRGVQKLSPVMVSSLGLLSPVTATLLGWYFLDEQLNTWQVAGMCVVLGSVYMLQTRRAARKIPAIPTNQEKATL